LKNIGKILEGLKFELVRGSMDVNIHNIQTDSRKVEKNDCFVAIKGFTTDGHDYISKAIEQGCSVVIVSKPMIVDDTVVVIAVEDTSEVLGNLVSNFYDHPSKKLNVCGITGTNGKTTCTFLLYDLFSKLGVKCGLISTIEIRIGEHIIPTSLTTPDALTLQRLMHQMVEEECQVVFMEVSSHAIHQNRIAGIDFKVGAFTNITHDHLDYHKDFKEYIQVKKKFFDNLNAESIAITNIDDRNGKIMIQNTKAHVKTYALKKIADYKGKLIDQSLEGLHLIVNDLEAYYKLCGEYNAYNILTVLAITKALGVKVTDSIPILTNLNSAEGRLEKVTSVNNKKTAFVDYAHTSDALKNVISTLQKMRKPGQKIITVIGCGGDRDRTKRPKMANTTALLSDIAIFTSDNPRTENPGQILKDMEVGVKESLKDKVLYVVDRKQAIKTAIMMASELDIILVAGKGHEKYMDVNGVKIPFDDKEIIKDIMNVY